MEETPRTAEGLIREMERAERHGCANCGEGLCSHQALMNIAMGFGDKPRCLPCLAAALERRAGELRDSLIAYLQQKECHRAAWEWADRHEGVPARGARNCLDFPPPAGGFLQKAAKAAKGSSLPSLPSVKKASAERKPAPLGAAIEWDADEMGCGDLVLELRARLQSIRAGEILKLCARDAGAPEDLPAWCRLTGHVLLRAEHPTYWIQRKK